MNLQAFNYGGEESRTPVRKSVGKDFSHHIRLQRFPRNGRSRQAPLRVALKVFSLSQGGGSESCPSIDAGFRADGAARADSYLLARQRALICYCRLIKKVCFDDAGGIRGWLSLLFKSPSKPVRPRILWRCSLIIA